MIKVTRSILLLLISLLIFRNTTDIGLHLFIPLSVVFAVSVFRMKSSDIFTFSIFSFSISFLVFEYMGVNVSVSIIIIAILSGMLLILFHGLVRFRWYFVIHTLLFTGIIIQLVFNLKKIDHWFFYSPVSLYMVYIFYMISVISVYFVYKREKWLRKASVYAVILIQFLLVTVHRWNNDIYITPDKLFFR
ncbi:MAG: hypothetical protein ACOCWO_06125, partial [Candidatus Muiribacteriaceae bacterium]